MVKSATRNVYTRTQSRLTDFAVQRPLENSVEQLKTKPSFISGFIVSYLTPCSVSSTNHSFEVSVKQICRSFGLTYMGYQHVTSIRYGPTTSVSTSHT